MSQIVSQIRIGRSLLRAAFVALCCVACVGQAWAAPRELSEPELADVVGQGLTTVSNSSLNGLNFSTITLNADVSLNANFQNIVMGQYTTATNNSTGADINIPLLQFGRSDGTVAQQTVQISDPYIQFVYNNTGAAGNNQVVGMRIGFEGISGDVGLLMSSVSGSLQISDSAGDVYTSNGSRSASACVGTTCLALSQFGGVTAGNASGPSRDFWISLLSQPVQFPAQSGMSQPNLAQAGVWLNWTDRLTALNTTGTPPPNVLALIRH